MPKINIKAIHILIVFVALGLFLLLIKDSSKKIAVFDLKRTYAMFLHQAASLPKQKMNILTKEFPQALTHAVNIYTQKNHVVVFVKSAVINGAQDITPAIQVLIAKEMHKNA